MNAADRFTEPALCAETDPELFFPEKGGKSGPAKAICRRCLAMTECLEWALDHDEGFGIWAGLTPHERRALRARRERRPSAIEIRQARVAEYLRKGWSPAAVAQLLGVSLRVVTYDRQVIERGAA